jgi:hypothetical protein
MKIVSGGQTGADRAALDVALALGIPCGGWVPKGRLAEDGRIPETYPNLVEAGSPLPDVRTELNVRDSDATLLFSRGPLTGGSAYTCEVAARLGKPCLHVDLAAMSRDGAVEAVRQWLEDVRPAVLNVAGPRASGDPEIYGLVRDVLIEVLSSAVDADEHG